MTPWELIVRKSHSACLHAQGAINRLKAAWCLRRERSRWNSVPDHLTRFEKRVYSQHGEDGVIEEIFRWIGTAHRHFAEFGIEDGSENNTRALLEKHGWSGLWIEGSESHAAKASHSFSAFPIQVENAFVTGQNITSLFRKCAVPSDLDLLSIDIDGNDFWALRAILREYSPRAIAVKYNASFSPEKALGHAIRTGIRLGRYELLRSESCGV